MSLVSFDRGRDLSLRGACPEPVEWVRRRGNQRPKRTCFRFSQQTSCPQTTPSSHGIPSPTDKSSQSGFIDSINASFRFRFQPLICFSRSSADQTSFVASYQTSEPSLWSRVNDEPCQIGAQPIFSLSHLWRRYIQFATRSKGYTHSRFGSACWWIFSSRLI